MPEAWPTSSSTAANCTLFFFIILLQKLGVQLSPNMPIRSSHTIIVIMNKIGQEWT